MCQNYIRDTHRELIRKQRTKLFGLLSRLFDGCSKLSLKNKLILYKLLIKPLFVLITTFTG